jgi:hypothetical protein
MALTDWTVEDVHAYLEARADKREREALPIPALMQECATYRELQLLLEESTPGDAMEDLETD